MKKTLIYLIALTIIAGGIVLLWKTMPAGSIAQQQAGSGSAKPRTVEGEAAIGGAFTLTNTEGNVVTEKDLLGKFSIVYFGFTYCPDICPTTLLNISQALDSLGKQGKKVRPVFITVDPQRDTVEVMKAYASNFHPDLLALTGTPEQTDAAAKAYKVFYKLKKEGDNPDYLVDHSGFAYLMDTQGNYLTHFTHDDNAETIMALLTRYIR